MENLESRTVGEIVTDNYKAADVFKKHNIDFCCGGNKNIKEVCATKSLDLKVIISELENISEDKSTSHDFQSWKLDFLIDYIINTHHTYVSTSIPQLIEYSDKVSKVHGSNHPETIRINELVHQVAQEMRDHMQKEEGMLFPYIKHMCEAKEKGIEAPVPPFGTVKNPIKMMEDEHTGAGNALKEVAKLSDGYKPPEDACNTYSVLYAKLDEFEQDLHKHVHLENNILFPKSILLEKELS